MYIDKPDKDFENSIIQLNALIEIAVDTETNGLDPHSNNVLLLQMGNESVQYVYNIYTLQNHLDPLLRILENEGVKKIMHNAYFDYKMILGNFNIRMKNIACTMVQEQLLTKGKVNTASEDAESSSAGRISVSLAAVAKKYFNVDLDKTQQTSFIDQAFNGIIFEDQYKYAANDIKLLLKIYNTQKVLLYNSGMDALADLENSVIPVFAEMSYNGIYLDRHKWLSLLPKAEEDIKKYAAELDKLVGHYSKEGDLDNLFNERLYDINYDSAVQMVEVLNKIYNLNLPDTSAKTLEKIKQTCPAAEPLIKYRQAKKIQTTYGRSFLSYININTGRIHSDFKQLHADTGRTSSANPNMQNLPRQQEYRTPFCVEDPVNYRFISADFSGQELRILAQLSKEPAFLNAIETGKDLHSYSASLLYNIPYEDFLEYDAQGNILYDALGEPVIKKEMKKKYRNPCKTITFGQRPYIGRSKTRSIAGMQVC